MLAQRHSFTMLYLLGSIILGSADALINSPFSCVGGSVYFSAHPADVLLYMSPDIYHDLYVYKCVTTVFLTSGDRGLGDNTTAQLERGLGGAFSMMDGTSTYKDDPVTGSTKVQLGDYDIDVWSPHWTKRVHNVYLRLPDSEIAGQGHVIYQRESLRKLYDGAIDSITTTDGNATFTLDSLQDLLAMILDVRKPNEVKTLSHRTSFPTDENDENAEHADHIVSAQLVVNAVKKKGLTVDIQQYAGDVGRTFEANLNDTSREYLAKVQAFFKYAESDDHMCQTLGDCSARIDNPTDETNIDNDARYVSRYLSREYYAA